jgi:hypothetical protein
MFTWKYLPQLNSPIHLVFYKSHLQSGKHRVELLWHNTNTTISIRHPDKENITIKCHLIHFTPFNSQFLKVQCMLLLKQLNKASHSWSITTCYNLHLHFAIRRRIHMIYLLISPLEGRPVNHISIYNFGSSQTTFTASSCLVHKKLFEWWVIHAHQSNRTLDLTHHPILGGSIWSNMANYSPPEPQGHSWPMANENNWNKDVQMDESLEHDRNNKRCLVK